MKNGMKHPVFKAVLFLLVFVLLREWLVLITQLTETGYFNIFLAFIAGSMVLTYFNVTWKVTVPLKILYLLWAVQVMFLDAFILSFEFITFLFNKFSSSILAIVAGQFGDVSNVVRTVFFFLFLWMLVYLVRYWIVVKQRVFLFYFTTIILVATADTFSAYSAEDSIFVLMIVGLLLLGMLNAFKVERENAQLFAIANVVKSVIPLLILLGISSVLVSFLPKYSPMWADPVPFIQSVVDDGIGAGGTGVSKSGYDQDDSQLGGPFLEDDSLVFEAEVEQKQYWKVEAKDLYTSKGWEQSIEGESPKQYALGELLDFVVVDEEEKVASLEMTEKYPFIVYPYGIQSVNSENDVMLSYDWYAEQYKTTMNDESFPLDRYDITFVEDSFSLKQLRETSIDQLTEVEGMDRFLQLPETLPERVLELAHAITESSDSVYDKAKAIERYFGRSGFTYERTEVAVPSEDEDYVDQFLFDTKKGYCDNFSSSMVVMLRSIGIPARWVKGFAPGELTRNDEGDRVYRVSNNEAHSWVEAYMPGIGWVPFEPTIGFNGVTNIDYDLELSSDDPEIEDMPKEEQEEVEKKEEQEKPDEKNNKTAFKMNDWTKKYAILMIIIGGAALFIGVMIYRQRAKWLPAIIIRLYSSENGDWKKFTDQYFQLIKQMERVGLKRKSSETLRTFSNRVDSHFGFYHFGKLTKIYEEGLYSGEEKIDNWEEVQSIWKEAMQRTSD